MKKPSIDSIVGLKILASAYHQFQEFCTYEVLDSALSLLSEDETRELISYIEDRSFINPDTQADLHCVFEDTLVFERNKPFIIDVLKRIPVPDDIMYEYQLHSHVALFILTYIISIDDDYIKEVHSTACDIFDTLCIY